jgi:hypothetical protein
MTTILTSIRQRFDTLRANAAERRDHDQAMADPRIRDEHFAARSRAVSAGEGDCPFCAF